MNFHSLSLSLSKGINSQIVCFMSFNTAIYSLTKSSAFKFKYEYKNINKYYWSENVTNILSTLRKLSNNKNDKARLRFDEISFVLWVTWEARFCTMLGRRYDEDGFSQGNCVKVTLPICGNSTMRYTHTHSINKNSALNNFLSTIIIFQLSNN